MRIFLLGICFIMGVSSYGMDIPDVQNFQQLLNESYTCSKAREELYIKTQRGLINMNNVQADSNRLFPKFNEDPLSLSSLDVHVFLYLFPQESIPSSLFDKQLQKAKEGDVLAQSNIGFIYLFGKKSSHNDALAQEFLNLAANQGEMSAQHHLAYMYEYGCGGVQQNHRLAFFYYRDSADQGYVPAQDALAHLYMNGCGVAKNEIKAFTYFKKAADQGDSFALSNIAYLHQNGMGTEKNSELAKENYRLAIAYGNTTALINLGFLYDQEKEYEKALKCYNKALLLGDTSAKEYILMR